MVSTLALAPAGAASSYGWPFRQLTRRLAAVDAREVELAQGVRPLHQRLELDLVRSVLQTYLRWLTRTEKALAREIRIDEDNH